MPQKGGSGGAGGGGAAASTSTTTLAGLGLHQTHLVALLYAFLARRAANLTPDIRHALETVATALETALASSAVAAAAAGGGAGRETNGTGGAGAGSPSASRGGGDKSSDRNLGFLRPLEEAQREELDGGVSLVVKAVFAVAPHAVDDRFSPEKHVLHGARAGGAGKSSPSPPSSPSLGTAGGDGGEDPLFFLFSDASRAKLLAALAPALDQFTALHFACALGLSQTVEVLLQSADASTLLVDSRKRPALDLVPEGKAFDKMRSNVKLSCEGEKQAAQMNSTGSAPKPGENSRLAGDVGRYRALVEAGDAAGLQKALGLVGVIHTEDESGETLLQLAVAAGVPEVVKTLLASGAMPDSRDNDKRTCLHKAIFAANDAAVPLLTQLLDIGRWEGRPVDVNPRDFEGVTPLHQACQVGREDIVSVLLAAGADVQQYDDQANTALHYACQPEAAGVAHSVAGQLVEAAAEKSEKALFTLLRAKDAAGRTAIHLAASSGRTDLLELLCTALFRYSGTDEKATRKRVQQLINEPDNDLHTPLIAAVIEGHERAVSSLLGKRPLTKKLRRLCDLSASDATAAAAIHRACFHKQSAILKLLLEAGVDPNGNGEGPESSASSPLHYAAFSGDANCVRLLLGASVDPMVRDSEKSTPLHKAAFCGNLEAALLLVSANCDPDVADDEGSTPLHKAAFAGRDGIVKLLLKHGASVNSQDADDGTPMHNAAFNGHPASIRALLEGGADIDSCDESGATALHLAATNGQRPACVELVNFAKKQFEGNEEEFANFLNAGDDRGMTPLHRALVHQNVVSYLISAGSDPNFQDQDGRSPLWYACRSHYVAASKLLISNGGDLDAKDKNGTSCEDALEIGAKQSEKAAAKAGRPLSASRKVRTAGTLRREFNKLAKSRSQAAGMTAAAPGGSGGGDLVATADASNPEGSVTQEYAKENGPAFAKVFNKEKKSQVAVDWLVENGHVRLTTLTLDERGNELDEEETDTLVAHPTDVAHFLFYTDDLDRALLGEYLGDLTPLCREVLIAYISIDNYTGLDFVDALRKFLTGRFRLPGEAQKIDRFMENFAEHYVRCNENYVPSADDNSSSSASEGRPSGDATLPAESLKFMAFPDLNSDVAYVLAFALIMVNTDAHNESVKNKMTLDQFISNNRGINNGEDVDRDFLVHCYTKIVTNEIRMDNSDAVFGHRQRSGWCKKQGGRWKTWKRRWLVLQDNCLYYFKAKEDEEPTGIIPLEDLQIRIADQRSKKFKFELYTKAGEVIKSCKSSNGQLVQGHHGSYLIEVQSQQEMDAWISAIGQNIAFNPMNDLLKERVARAASKRAAVTRRPSLATKKTPTPSPKLAGKAAPKRQTPDKKVRKELKLQQEPLTSRDKRMTGLPDMADDLESEFSKMRPSTPKKSQKTISRSSNVSTKTTRASATTEVDFSSLAAMCELCKSCVSCATRSNEQAGLREATKKHGRLALFFADVGLGVLLKPNANQVAAVKGQKPPPTAFAAIVLTITPLDGESDQIALKRMGAFLDEKLIQSGLLELNSIAAPATPRTDEPAGSRGSAARRWPLQILGHGLGGAAAIVFGAHLKREGYRISKAVAFGTPAIVPVGKAEAVFEEAGLHGKVKNKRSGTPALPVTRVSHLWDHTPTLKCKTLQQFQTPEVILMPPTRHYAMFARGRSPAEYDEAQVFLRDKYFKEGKSAAEAAALYHSIEAYSDALKAKAKVPPLRMELVDYELNPEP